MLFGQMPNETLKESSTGAQTPVKVTWASCSDGRCEVLKRDKCFSTSKCGLEIGKYRCLRLNIVVLAENNTQGHSCVQRSKVGM